MYVIYSLYKHGKESVQILIGHEEVWSGQPKFSAEFIFRARFIGSSQKMKLHFAINKTFKSQRVSPRLIKPIKPAQDYCQRLLAESANFSLLLLVLCRPELILRSSKKYLFSKEKSHFRRSNFLFHVLVPPFFVVNCTVV